MYFSSVEEMNNYFPNGVSNMVLAIVQASDDEPAVLYTSSNNQSMTGQSQSQGGYIDSPTEIEEKEEALDLSQEILEGENE